MLNNIYMKDTTIYKQCLIYIFFTATLILGFYLGEDLSGGAIYDYGIHKLTIESVFLNGLSFGLLNYDDFSNTHSPIFIIILKYLIFNNEIIGRLIYLLISSLVVVVFYKSLVLKYNKNFLELFILSNFFFLSPYFRGSAIWPGDETIAIIFLCLAIYYSLKFLLSEKKSLFFLLLNVLCLALASYLRPIYCIFSIYFFFIFFVNTKINLKFFILYFILNFFLSFPAFYYVFILDVNFFSNSLGDFNIFNTFTLLYLTIFFYLTPFILLDFKKIILKFNLNNFLLTIIVSIFVIFLFNYNNSQGGGFYLKISEIIFGSQILVYLFFPLAFYYCNQILELNRIKNSILFLLFIFIEIDGYFFMESYDPLFYMLFFTLFNLDINRKVFQNLYKSISLIFLFQIFLLFAKFYQLNFINDLKLI